MRAEIVYTTIKVKYDTWKRINSEREVTDTMDDVLTRMLDDRDQLKKMFKGELER